MEMKRIERLALLIFFSCLVANGQNSAKIPMIDETQEFTEKVTQQNVDGASGQAIDIAIKRDAVGFWQVGAKCASQSKILGIRKGFFVSKNENQLAALYSLCAGFQGLIILDQGKVSVHYGFKNESITGISRLEDINKNGFDEILIRLKQNDQDVYFRKHVLIELSSKDIDELFHYQTYRQEFNALTDMMYYFASKIYVEKAEKPIFYEELFKRSKGSWTNNGQSIRYDSRWEQVKQMTRLDTFPAMKPVKYFKVKSINKGKK